MAEAQRFTGEKLVVKAVPTGGSELTLSGDFTAFSTDVKQDTVDTSAGNQKEKTELPTLEGMSWSLTAFNGDFDTWTAFRTVATGVMTIYPQGIGDGLPYSSFNYVTTGRSNPTGNSKADELTISGDRTGAMIVDWDTAQGAIRHLVFTVQPTDTASASKIASVEVSVENATPAVVTVEQSDVITITATGTTPSGVLSARVINGVAKFPGIVVTGTHTGATLTATSAAGYTSATSSTFDVT